MAGGPLGNVISSETDVGPAAAIILKVGDLPYLSPSCFTNVNQRLRYTRSHGIGSFATVPWSGPYGISNRSVFAPSRAHAGEKKPGKMATCTHFFDDSAAANSSSSFDQSGLPWTGSMSRQLICTETPLMKGLFKTCKFIE